MGPPPFGDGKGVGRDAGGHPRPASMGPPPFGDGKLVQQVHAAHAGSASMGPPPFGDGKDLVATDGVVHVCPLQWGHRLSAMESASTMTRVPCCTDCFNGATAFRRWKVLQADRAWRASWCFNGATAFRRWKERDGGAARGLHLPASMGPPPFGDGKTVWVVSVPPVEVASMGPPPFGDGKETRSA